MKLSAENITRQRNLKLLHRAFEKQAALAAALDVTPGYVHQLLVGYRPIGEKAARKIERALGLPAYWMDEPRAFDTPVDTIEDVLSLSSSKPLALPAPAQQPGNTRAGPQLTGFVPVLDWAEAKETDWSESMQQITSGTGEQVPAIDGCSAQTFALRVQGDSMAAPHGLSVPHGTVIYVDPDQASQAQSGALVIARLTESGELTFKRLVHDAGRAFLQPLNPQYPTIHAPFEVVGLVLGAYTDLRP